MIYNYFNYFDIDSTINKIENVKELRIHNRSRNKGYISPYPYLSLSTFHK